MRSAAIFPVFELEEQDLSEFDESCISDIELDYFNYSMDFINEEFNKSKEERVIEFNSEISKEDVLATFEEINDIVESRNINLYE
ncbi:MAG TPA: hypothetical protein VK982_01435 [Bacteroidales bacterium]|nr:hypothetical protein [Bacteroidales bacterium]